MALALAIGCHPSALSQWASGRRKVTPAFAAKIDAATGGQVKREWLRPDIFG